MNVLNYFAKQKVTARFFAVITIFSLILGAFPAAFFVANAATNLSGPDSTSFSDDGTQLYESAEIDATVVDIAYFSFDYDGGTTADANDTVEYGWKRTSDATANILGEFDFKNGNAVDTGSVFAVLPGSALVSDLIVFFRVKSGTFTAADDFAEFTNIIVEGEEEPEGAHNTRETVYTNPTGNIDFICHSANDGYVQNPPNLSSIVKGTGHGGDADDIIPPFWYKFDDADPVNLYLGKNWDDEGKAIYKADCSEPQQEVPGCTDAAAINYNPQATQDDKSCEYAGTLVVNKSISGTDSPVNWFNFTVNGENEQAFSAQGVELQVAPGFYTIVETNPGDFDVSYESCGENGTIEVVANATSTCLVENTYEGNEGPIPGSITIEKIAGGGDAVAFDFTGDLGESGSFMLMGNSSTTFDKVASGTYNVFEQSETGWELLDVTCTDETVFNQSNGVSITLSEDEHVTCTFTNRPVVEEPIYGCTDPDATNYNPEATHDDKSCEYEPVLELPQCSAYFTEGIVVTQEQVLLSHDEGGAFIGPVSVDIPAGYYDINALSFDFHTIHTWDTQDSEVWFFKGLWDGIVQFISGTTDDLPQGQDEIVTNVGQSVYFANGLDAIEYVHGAYVNDGYHSIYPLCLQFLPVEPEICEPEEHVFADAAVDSNQGTTKSGGAVVLNRSNPIDATGEPDWTAGGSTGFYSLGFGGWIEVVFDKYVLNVDGDDLSVHEATNGTYPLEEATVEVSQNGTDWYELTETARNNKNEGGSGVTLLDFNETGLDWIRYVRITDISNAALHNAAADGFDLDTVDATYVVCEEPETEVEMCSLDIVSDTGTVIVENNAFAVETYTHGNWTADIGNGNDAEWIWENYSVLDPEAETVLTFKETFEVVGGTNANLSIAADNSYMAWLNGNLVIDQSGEGNNFNNLTQDEDIDVTSFLVDGENELLIEVTNYPLDNANYMQNPAGVLYRLTLEGEEESCEVTTDIDEVDEEDYLIDGYKYEQGESETTPLANWTIELYDEEGFVMSTSTDDEGYYYFYVPAGNYEVKEVMPEGWEQHAIYDGGVYIYTEEGVQSCSFSLPYEDDIYPVFNSISVLIQEEIYNYSDFRCSFYNVRTDEEEGGGGDGEEDRTRGVSSGTRLSRPGPTPLVLGESTSQCEFLLDYMQMGIENNPFEVTKLQMFLKIVMGYDNPVTGFFGPTTDANVKLFQEQYRSEILDPWYSMGIVPHNNPTGYVYKTTKWKINDIVCPGWDPYPSFDGENLQSNVDLH